MFTQLYNKWKIYIRLADRNAKDAVQWWGDSSLLNSTLIEFLIGKAWESSSWQRRELSMWNFSWQKY